MKFDLVLFDLDGTLCDTVDDITVSVNMVLAAAGRPALPASTVRGLVGHGARVLLEKVFDGHPPGHAVEHFARHYAEHCVVHTRLYPSVKDTLQALPMAKVVLTNKGEAVSRKILTGLGVAGQFQRVVGGDTFPTRKPDPTGALEVISEYKARKAAIVGDSEIDIQTGRAAGLTTIAVTYGYSRPGELAGADYRIDRFADLVSLLTG